MSGATINIWEEIAKGRPLNRLGMGMETPENNPSKPAEPFYSDMEKERILEEMNEHMKKLRDERDWPGTAPERRERLAQELEFTFMQYESIERSLKK